jgi:hypothetical protein
MSVIIAGTDYLTTEDSPAAAFDFGPPIGRVEFRTRPGLAFDGQRDRLDGRANRLALPNLLDQIEHTGRSEVKQDSLL